VSRRGEDLGPGPPTLLAPGRLTARSVLMLQRLAGNASTVGLVVQRLLKLNDPASVTVGHLQQQLNAAGAKPRLPVTGRFDAGTKAAVVAFQAKYPGLKGSTAGEVNNATQKQLNLVAPLASPSGEKTVVVGGEEVRGLSAPPEDHLHLALAAKGAAVRELQERINGSTTMSAAKRKGRASAKDLLSLDGYFGPLTEAALKQFQTDSGLKPSGTSDGATWKQLLAAAAATQGRVEYEWREEVEGVTNVGDRARYEWKLSADRLLISANINFVPAGGAKAADVSGRVHEWLTDIRSVWNSFKAVNKANKKDAVRIDFEARQKTGDFTVNVWKDAKRSDSANWHTGDHRRGLAPHEFGHLIGLADEYNRDEGQYLAATGEEVPVGAVGGIKDADADAIAKRIKAQIPITDKGANTGLALSNAVTIDLGAQGGDSRLVAQHYTALYGSSITKDIPAAFQAKGITGFNDHLSAAISPFLYENKSIMGTMDLASAATVKATGHDHSVEPRHVRPFVNIIIRERTLQSGTPVIYEPVRR
jgi:peptidoglycan hydrolase-like protein with peptidoglycan-binding domain